MQSAITHDPQRYAQMSELYAPLFQTIIELDRLVFGEVSSPIIVLDDEQKEGIDGIHPYEFLTITHSTVKEPLEGEAGLSREKDVYLLWHGSTWRVLSQTLRAERFTFNGMGESLKRMGIVAVRRRVLFRRDLIPKAHSKGVPKDLREVELYALRSGVIEEVRTASPTIDDHFTCELVIQAVRAGSDPERMIAALTS